MGGGIGGGVGGRVPFLTIGTGCGCLDLYKKSGLVVKTMFIRDISGALNESTLINLYLGLESTCPLVEEWSHVGSKECIPVEPDIGIFWTR